MSPKFRFVFFDVDSTLVTIEGIDVLAPGNTEIAELTERAMSGEIAIDDVYARRLEIIRPSRADLEALGRTYCESLTDGAKETLDTLRDAGVQVHLVTAGLAPAILPLAAHLGIAARAVHAVNVTFAEDGTYRDFDRRSFLTRSGGKELVVRDVRARSHGKAAFVGDGVTDLDAKRGVDFFVGFGGVHVRERVKQNADVFVTDRDLRAVLKYVM